MCELLVRTVDKTNPGNPLKHSQLTKRGDVIVVGADGHPWSEAERMNPEWTILKVPGLSELAASSFTTRGRDRPGYFAPARAFGLDLDRLARKSGKLTPAMIEAAKVRRASYEDPTVIGDDPGVLG